MNIQTTISIYAGGVGSGPNAPCPQCGPGHSFKEGDRVKLKQGALVSNPKSGAKNYFKPDSIAVVTSVLPKVGNQEQMVGVHSEEDQGEGKFGNLGYARMKDLILHQPAFDKNPFHKTGSVKQGAYVPAFDKSGKVVAPDPHALTVKPVPKSQTIMHTTTNDGASLTWVKPHSDSEPTQKTMQQLSNTEHSLKGKFGLLTTVQGVDHTSRIYDSSKTPLESRSVSKGATVWVNTDVDKGKINNVTIKEQNYAQYAQKTDHMTFSYKNAAKAVGMLKTRYGITTSLKKLRGGQ